MYGISTKAPTLGSTENVLIKVNTTNAKATTVGMRVQLDHLIPVAVGSKVRADATLERCEGRRLTFAVSVTCDAGLVAAGKVTRVIVNRDHFMERVR